MVRGYAPPPPVNNNMQTDPALIPTSPYFIHPSDGPSSVTVTPLLSGSNYHAWARSMRRALGAKNKFDFVDGSIPVPIDDFNPSYKAWTRCNMIVHSWLMNSVSDSIGQSIVFLENAVDVWNDLKERFSQGDLIRISELQQEIYGLKQGNSSVTEFFSDLKILWEELETYMPMPTCSCSIKCSCESMRQARKNHDLNYAIRFLTGLNENFSVVKSQILLIDPLPTINKIFSMVLQHERQSNFISSDDSKALINAVHDYRKPYGRGKPFGPKAGTRVCTFCGRNGHTVDYCYKKHGLPPHMKREGNSQMANNVTGDIDSNSDFGDAKGALDFTPEQYQKIMNLIQEPSTTSASNSVTVHQVVPTRINSTQHGHSPIENHRPGKEVTEDSWFG